MLSDKDRQCAYFYSQSNHDVNTLGSRTVDGLHFVKAYTEKDELVVKA
jgi:hypothetical protein